MEMSPGYTLLDQYFSIKDQYKDALVLFQVGKFYQLYYHDAVVISQELGAKIISRAVGGGKRAPMCGVPVASGDAYAEKLAGKGFRVVLCAQGEERDEHGMTVREVVQVVEPDGGQRRDLTQAWEEHLSSGAWEELCPPPGPKPKRAAAPAGEGELLRRLRDLRLEDMTPMEAMKLLYDWKRMFAGEPAGTDRL